MTFRQAKQLTPGAYVTVHSAEEAAADVHLLDGLEIVAEAPWETPEWLRATAGSFSAWSCKAIIVRDGGSARAAVLLGSRDRNRLAPLRVAADLEICEPTDVACADSVAADLLASAMVRCGRPLLISRARRGSLFAQHWTSGEHRRAVVRARPAAASPTLELSPDWYEPEGLLSAHQRRVLRWHSRRANQRGPVSSFFVTPAAGESGVISTRLSNWRRPGGREEGGPRSRNSHTSSSSFAVISVQWNWAAAAESAG